MKRDKNLLLWNNIYLNYKNLYFFFFYWNDLAFIKKKKKKLIYVVKISLNIMLLDENKSSNVAMVKNKTSVSVPIFKYHWLVLCIQ